MDKKLSNLKIVVIVLIICNSLLAINSIVQLNTAKRYYQDTVKIESYYSELGNKHIIFDKKLIALLNDLYDHIR